jgi:hypothetical protein
MNNFLKIIKDMDIGMGMDMDLGIDTDMTMMINMYVHIHVLCTCSEHEHLNGTWTSAQTCTWRGTFTCTWRKTPKPGLDMRKQYHTGADQISLRPFSSRRRHEK